MKKLLLIGLPLIAAMLAVLFLTNKESVDPDSKESQERVSALRSAEEREKSLAEKSSRFESKQSVEERIKLALEGADPSSEKYRILVDLLKNNEEETLRILATLRYPDVIDEDSQDRKEIEMITRATTEVYRREDLAGILEKMNSLMETTHLRTSILADIFGYTEGEKNTETLYDWAIKNPEDRAVEISGSAIGGRLIDFTREKAWERAQSFPEGTMRENVFGSVVAGIAAEDLNEAIDLINELEPTQDIDQAISNLVGNASINEYEPESLVSLAAAQVRPEYRSSSLQSLFSSWAQEDIEGFQQWSQSIEGYSPEILAEINVAVKQTLRRNSHRLQQGE